MDGPRWVLRVWLDASLCFKASAGCQVITWPTGVAGFARIQMVEVVRSEFLANPATLRGDFATEVTESTEVVLWGRWMWLKFVLFSVNSVLSVAG
ncbi:hypothetical protein RB11844 [Rhodopirellula baltica SH 1]|uniref:Uncharacterized protein n=1 Tax=Rhodopirellula baltica (strain DSM 10527 / NCIMB 13988 / SH1) TaxID=243090 RepID=Q7UJK3_RHOBA|nr:hypothetical protein RB11844 [Rhodopirellula baltica SH 1]